MLLSLGRRKAIMRQKSPMASDRANPRMAYENSCCFRLGFLAYPMMRDPNTDPIPAPDPATPTVAAPAPMNLAAESMSRLAAVVWRHLADLMAGTWSLLTTTRPQGARANLAMRDILGKFQIGCSDLL